MSSNITKIDYGQQNWNEPINQNFENLDQDSGWISIQIVAPFTGEVQVRKHAHHIEVWGAVKTNDVVASTAGTRISTLPNNLFSYVEKFFVSYMDNEGIARLGLSKSGDLLFFSSTSTLTNNTIRIYEIIDL